MKKLIKLIFLFVFAFPSVNIYGQVEDTTKMSSLMVYGDGFTFSVREPVGWKSHIDHAKDLYANITFYKSAEDFINGGVLIQVSSFKKEDEKTEKDLEYDIQSYEGDHPDLKQQDLEVGHKEYKCYSKLIYVEGDFYQYLVYVNPGENYKSGLSVAMNISKRAASEEELKVFREIVASLIMFKG